MLKKIFIAAFMINLIVAQNVSAEEILVYENDTYSCYVIPETFENKTVYRDNRAFDVKVKLVYVDGYFNENNYSFWENDGIVWYQLEGSPNTFTINETESAAEIWNFGLKYLNLDYEISYE